VPASVSFELIATIEIDPSAASASVASVSPADRGLVFWLSETVKREANGERDPAAKDAGARIPGIPQHSVCVAC